VSRGSRRLRVKSSEVSTRIENFQSAGRHHRRQSSSLFVGNARKALRGVARTVRLLLAHPQHPSAVGDGSSDRSRRRKITKAHRKSPVSKTAHLFRHPRPRYPCDIRHDPLARRSHYLDKVITEHACNASCRLNRNEQKWNQISGDAVPAKFRPYRPDMGPTFNTCFLKIVINSS